MQLIERSDGRGSSPVEVLVNSPKITKCIETGETKEILEEMETSVSYYRMQSIPVAHRAPRQRRHGHRGGHEADG